MLSCVHRRRIRKKRSGPSTPPADEKQSRGREQAHGREQPRPTVGRARPVRLAGTTESALVSRQASDNYCRRLSTDKVLCMLKATEGGGCRMLTRDYLLSYVARNFGDMCTSPRFVNLRAPILSAVLTSRDLIARETTAVRAVARWVRWDPDARRSHVRTLAPLLRVDESPLQCCAVVLANWDVFRHAEGDILPTNVGSSSPQKTA